VARATGTRRLGIELRHQPFRVPTLSDYGEAYTRNDVTGESFRDAAQSKDPVHVWKLLTREPGDPVDFLWATCRMLQPAGTVRKHPGTAGLF